MSLSLGALKVNILLCKQLQYFQAFLSSKSSKPQTLTLIYTVYNSVPLGGNSRYDLCGNLLHDSLITKKKTDIHKTSLSLVVSQM